MKINTRYENLFAKNQSCSKYYIKTLNCQVKNKNGHIWRKGCRKIMKVRCREIIIGD